jgi:hypothetical protein
VLDSYLKDARVRFREVFNQFDSVSLDSREFKALDRHCCPRATGAQLAYFQVGLGFVLMKVNDGSSGEGVVVMT